MRERERGADKNQECVYFWPQSERERERKKRWRDKRVKRNNTGGSQGRKHRTRKGEEMRALKKTKRKGKWSEEIWSGGEVWMWRQQSSRRKCCGLRLINRPSGSNRQREAIKPLRYSKHICTFSQLNVFLSYSTRPRSCCSSPSCSWFWAEVRWRNSVRHIFIKSQQCCSEDMRDYCVLQSSDGEPA